MKTYKKIEVHEVQAVQYFKDEKENSFVKLCQTDYEGKIRKVPGDLMGTPKNAFNAVKTASGWTPIQDGDWIIQKESEVFVVANGVFQLLFKEA